jgi:hypothetical protein
MPDLGPKHARRTSTPTAMQCGSVKPCVDDVCNEWNDVAASAVVLAGSPSSSRMSAVHGGSGQAAATRSEPPTRTDMGQQPLRELLKLVQHHKQHLLVHGAHPASLVCRIVWVPVSPLSVVVHIFLCDRSP